jgi:uncharacterized integral membrane protein
MFNLIIIVIFAVIFGYFTSQNIIELPINLGPYTFEGVPLYQIVGATLVIGLLLSWIISLFRSLTTSHTLRQKQVEIDKHKLTIRSMTKKINELELTNAKLKGELGTEPIDEISL